MEGFIAHLVEMIAPLFIGHDHQTQHFFTGQLYRMLGISRQALDGYVERGQLTTYRRTLARRVFVKESEINRLLELLRADDEDQ